MKTDLKKIIEIYIDNWAYYVTKYGVDDVIIKKANKISTEFNYHFEIVNGSFREETIAFNFRYFRKLELEEISKFIFRSLCAHESNWEFKHGKFYKKMIVY
jgi:hypothetical protein